MSLEISDRSVSPFADELRACLSEMLRGPVPEAAEADDPVRFFEQWLAQIGRASCRERVSYHV